MPFWKRIGFRTVVWSTWLRATGRRSAAIRTREPLPDRDPDATLHFLLDPFRRAGHELVLLGIQEQNGRCVCTEDVANP